MKNTLKYTFLSALFLGFVACDVDNTLSEIKGDAQNTIVLEAGSVDFSKYVAIGASFTAGFTDGALFKTGQENSFPNTLASKFAMVGGGGFIQPLMNDNIGGMVSAGVVQLNPRYYFNGSAPTLLNQTPTTVIGMPATGSNFSNFGIPGAKSFHFIAPGYGLAAGLATNPMTANPYFVRMSPTESTLIAEVVSKQPTFFSLSEVGGNDVLDYAIAGGSSGEITSEATFNFAYKKITDALTATNAKGVVANLPYITSLPHFTTVPHNPVPMDANTATAVNQGFAPYNAGIKLAFAYLVANTPMTQEMADAEITKRTINFSEGSNNSVVIIDKNLTDLSLINVKLKNYRQATQDDLLVLPSKNIIGTSIGGNPLLINGVSVPLADKWVLTKTEVAKIRTATDNYNATIKTIASAKGWAFVDFNAILQQAASSGLEFDNYYMTTSLVTGGLVGLDGIHLTGRGYALMANEMLKAIDLTYGSNFSKAVNGLAKADDFPTNYSPTLQ